LGFLNGLQGGGPCNIDGTKLLGEDGDVHRLSACQILIELNVAFQVNIQGDTVDVECAQIVFNGPVNKDGRLWGSCSPAHLCRLTLAKLIGKDIQARYAAADLREVSGLC
jgi:hypothetical protein